MPTKLTLAQIRESRVICEAATPGEWVVGEDPRECAATLRAQPARATDGRPMGGPVDVIIPFGRAYSDARFCAHARTILPAALDEIEKLRELLREVVELAEYLDASYVPKFPGYGGPTQTQKRLAAIRKEVE